MKPDSRKNHFKHLCVTTVNYNSRHPSNSKGTMIEKGQRNKFTLAISCKLN